MGTVIYTNYPYPLWGKIYPFHFSAFFVVAGLLLFVSANLFAQSIPNFFPNPLTDVSEKGYRPYPAFPDSAIFYTKKSLVPLENKNSSKFTEALLFLSNIYNYREEFDSIGKYASMALQQTYADDSLAEGYRYIAFNNLAGYYLLIGDFKQADILYQNSLQEHLSDKDHARILFNIGLARKKQGDYPGALRVLDQTENFSTHTDAFFKAEIANLKSKICIRMQNWDQARENNLHATRLLQPFQDEVALKKKLELAFGLGLIETSCGNSLHAFQAIRTGQKLQASLNGYRTEITYGIIARVYANSGHIDSAIYYAQIARDQMVGQLADLPRHPLVAEAWLDLGNIQLQANLPDDALLSFFQGMKCLVNRPVGVNTLPEVGDFSYPVDAVSLLRGMGSASRQKFEENGSLDDLKHAMTVSLLATRLIPRIYREFQDEESRLFIAEQAVNTYEEAIAVALELATCTSERQYTETAFYLAEQNKAAVLYFSLQEAEKIHALGIPDSVTKQEIALKTELTFYQERYFEETRKPLGGNAEKLSRWKEKIFQLEGEIRVFQHMMETRYPRYFQLKYQEKDVSALKISKLIPENTALLEYFCGKRVSCLFVISDGQMFVEKIPPRDSLAKWIFSLRQGILHQKKVESDDTETPFSAHHRQYIRSARKLYESLIAPLKIHSKDLPQKLVIVPDDVLGYLPFDILLSDDPVFPGKFRQFPYMIRRHEISYTYSAALLYNRNIQASKEKPVQLLAFGPWYSQSQPGDTLMVAPALTYSGEEIAAITSIFHGESFLGIEATKERFLNLSKNFQMIHLSTHTLLNDADSKYSRITFAPSGDTIRENEFLSIAEICNLRLQAEMVVLSACETGMGKLQEGEGILSLARAFTYAGAKSIVTTLWKVDDRATAVIMKDFYQYLDRGYSKDYALRQAKLDYLDNNDNRLAHPFFWGAAIPIGNMAPVRSSSRLIPVLLIFSMVMMISGFFFVKKARIR